MQRIPLLHAVNDADLFRGRRCSRNRRIAAMRGGFVFRLGRLDAARQVAASANQVPFGIIEFVVIEVQCGLGLGQVEFQSVRLVPSGLC